MLSSPLIITLLTVFTFILGLIPILFSSYLLLLITLSLALCLSYILPQFNHMGSLQLLKCLITTYIFGIVDGYVWVNFSW